ncbi:DnaJ protein homolog 1, partial [Linum grandiflorum]
ATNAGSSRPSLLETSRSTNYSVRRCLPPLVFTASTITRKPPPVEMIVECTLEELFRGRVKRIKIVRDVIKNGIYMQEEETVKIKLTPGWKSGTKITFEGKPANEDDKQRSDVILVIQEKPHHLFSRDGDNLVYDVDIPLTDALAGCTLSVPMLSKDNMWLSFADDEVIYPGYEKVIRGQGMPVPDEKGKKGDFVIRFSVIFPTELSSERRRKACEILQECCWECPLT